MNELKQFDLARFVQNLNSQLSVPDKKIELGKFSPRTKRRRQYIRGRYGVFLVDDVVDFPGSMGLSFLDMEEREKIGEISVVGEHKRFRDYFENAYQESVALRLKRPISVGYLGQIPACKVIIKREMTEKPDICRPLIRRDYVPGFLFHRKADLRSVLPTEWFE